MLRVATPAVTAWAAHRQHYSPIRSRGRDEVPDEACGYCGCPLWRHASLLMYRDADWPDGTKFVCFHCDPGWLVARTCLFIPHEVEIKPRNDPVRGANERRP